ncbi:Kinetochore complex Sim4 subunit Fta1 domain containing protein [Hyaloscypha variabilis]
MAPETPNQQYPLYNTTFSLYRISPLYTGNTFQFSNAALHQHARRFRDILAGDVLRGVRVGLGPEDNVLARVGALQTVTWKLLQEEEAWAAEDETELGNDDTTISLAVNRGILVTVTYEKMAYRAILLRARREGNYDETVDSAREDDDGFQRFPLLLSKMPGPLRETFADYLSTTFDARVSALRLSSTYLTDTFEKYLGDISIGGDGEVLEVAERSRSLRNVIKEVAVYLGFDLQDVSNSLKTIDIQIAREDLPKLIMKGLQIGKQGTSSNPFLDALTLYIKVHLSLNMADERVKVLRIACGAFVLGGEGRVKITQPLSNADGDSPQSRATRRMVNDLISAASGGALSRPEGIP